VGFGDKAVNPSTKWADHGARWLAQDLGRWLAPDPPLDYPAAKKVMAAPWNLSNPYTALGNNPVLFEDGDGEALRIWNQASTQYKADANGEIVIKWASRSGLKFENDNGQKGTMSPFTALVHEVGHATDYLLSRTFFKRLQGTPDLTANNKAERKAIDGPERAATELMNETARDNHSGSPINVSGPFSSDPK
jgi:RHS repeat-associated protein